MHFSLFMLHEQVAAGCNRSVNMRAVLRLPKVHLQALVRTSCIGTA